MFVLRKISGQGVEMNFALGKNYTVINREYNYEEFKRTFKSHFGYDHVADLDDTADDMTKKCYCFVHGEDETHQLVKNQKSFIMTQSGSTFANLSYR